MSHTRCLTLTLFECARKCNNKNYVNSKKNSQGQDFAQKKGLTRLHKSSPLLCFEYITIYLSLSSWAWGFISFEGTTLHEPLWGECNVVLEKEINPHAQRDRDT